MNIQNDGGPAFARAGFTSEQTESQEGMSLRAYFAAHAPDAMPSWFRPDARVEMPANNPEWKWCENCKADCGDCTGDADCEKIQQYRRDRDAAMEQNQQHKYFQWRWAYADAMIEEMNRKD